MECGKIGIQHQKFGDAVRPQIRRVALQYASNAVQERSRPIHSSGSGSGTRLAVKFLEMHAHQHGDRDGALQIAAGLDELPAFAVASWWNR